MTTKETLINVTSKLIREKGVSATGIAEIVEISQIPKGSVYHHFPNGKDELIIAALHNYRDLMASAFKLSIKGKSTASTGLKAVIDYFILSLQNSDYKNGCPLAIVALEASGNNNALQLACKEVMDYWINNLHSYFIYKQINLGKNAAIEFITRLEGALIMSQIYKDTKFLIQLKKQINSIVDE
jgi:TetR/AcrR family transcriptional repressor of lmrAB and yxaGH operons